MKNGKQNLQLKEKWKRESPVKGNEKRKAESAEEENEKWKAESPVKENEKRKAESPVKEITGKKKKGAGTYDCTFKKDWTKEWSFITAANDPHSFHCVICARDVSCKHQGRADVVRHIKKDSHQRGSKDKISCHFVRSKILLLRRYIIFSNLRQIFFTISFRRLL